MRCPLLWSRWPATIEGAVEAERVPPPAAELASLPPAAPDLEPEPSAATEIEPLAATCVASDKPSASRAAVLEVIARLEALRPAAGKPDRTRIEAEAFALVAACVEFSKADLGRIASVLRGLGCTQEFAANWQAAVREAKATHSGANAAATPDVVPYEADAGHLYHVRLRPTESGWEVERTVICDFSAEIAEEVTTEDGARSTPSPARPPTGGPSGSRWRPSALPTSGASRRRWMRPRARMRRCAPRWPPTCARPSSC